MPTSSIMQEMSQTGEESIFAGRNTPEANIEWLPVWDISCIIKEVCILQRGIPSDQS